MGHFELHVAVTFGSLLGVCLLAGLIAERFHFPKVTAYLLVGLAMGPSVLNWLPDAHLHALDTITKLAMSLVLFNLGCHFPLSHVRKIFRRSLWLSFGELSATFLLVMLGLLLFGQRWEAALLLATLALATAPATTILVLRESASEGPVTERANTLVSLNNFASIVAFEVAFIAVHLANEKLTYPLSWEIGFLIRDLFGSLFIGVLAGLGVSYGCGLLKQSHWLVLLIATATVVLGCCETFEMPYMLAFMVMGVVVVNSSDLSEQILQELERLTALLCVLFFAVHGAELDLRAFQAAGMIGAVYIIMRSAGKWAGIAVAARIIGEPPQVCRWLGTSLLAQAGAAIALSAIAVQRDPELGRPIQTLILGSVVFFEIVGPFLLRYSVLRAGEIPLAQAIHHTSVDPWNQFLAIWNRLLLALGYHPTNQSPDELTVARLMRKNVEGIPESASFDEIVRFIERSHDNTYPVVNAENAITGVISYSRLSATLFDPLVGPLVRAEDLSTSVKFLLHPDDPVAVALELFRKTSEDCIPVASREQPHELLGIVRRSDVTSLLLQELRRRS